MKKLTVVMVALMVLMAMQAMPCADGNMMEKTAGADSVQDSNVQDYHKHARCEPEVDNRNSNGRRELPVWLL